MQNVKRRLHQKNGGNWRGYSVFYLLIINHFFEISFRLASFPKLSFFIKCRKIRVKLASLFFWSILACNNRPKFFHEPPPTQGCLDKNPCADIALSRSQLNHVLHWTFILCFKSINFFKIGLNLSYFCKELQRRDLSHTPLPSTVGGVSPNPQPLAAGSALPPNPRNSPHCNVWLRACFRVNFTSFGFVLLVFTIKYNSNHGYIKHNVKINAKWCLRYYTA